MSDQHAEFRNRVSQLARKHAQSGQGYTARMRDDGLIVVEPRKPIRPRRSGRSLLLFLCAGVLFKGLLIASLGYNSYNLRVAALSEGSLIERGGALIMYPEPVSVAVAENLMPFLR